MWHVTQHVACDKCSMCCTWFAHDFALATRVCVGDSSRHSVEIVKNSRIVPLDEIIIIIIVSLTAWTHLSTNTAVGHSTQWNKEPLQSLNPQELFGFCFSLTFLFCLLPFSLQLSFFCGPFTCTLSRNLFKFLRSLTCLSVSLVYLPGPFTCVLSRNLFKSLRSLTRLSVSIVYLPGPFTCTLSRNLFKSLRSLTCLSVSLVSLPGPFTSTAFKNALNVLRSPASILLSPCPFTALSGQRINL